MNRGEDNSSHLGLTKSEVSITHSVKISIGQLTIQFSSLGEKAQLKNVNMGAGESMAFRALRLCEITKRNKSLNLQNSDTRRGGGTCEEAENKR